MQITHSYIPLHPFDYSSDLNYNPLQTCKWYDYTQQCTTVCNHTVIMRTLNMFQHQPTGQRHLRLYTFSRPSSFRLMTSKSNSLRRPSVLFTIICPVSPFHCACGRKSAQHTTDKSLISQTCINAKQNRSLVNL